NAFFSGFGKRKTIVLHDTLLNNHSDDEILSVIAHETGHYKKKHIIKMLAFSSATSGIMLYLLFQFLESPHPSTIIGIESKTYHASILVFGILFGPISFIFQTIANKFSRTYEFEADEYAKLTTDGKTLSNALKKFSIEHLSNLTPHKLYVFFHYSHPPTIERIYKLEGTNK
ncbi:MAG: M48 family metalloprotease, partial [Spirochaetia bacterium]|nr:M48 family metalloprotease [Spirochaetia bacterium]